MDSDALRTDPQDFGRRLGRAEADMSRWEADVASLERLEREAVELEAVAREVPRWRVAERRRAAAAHQAVAARARVKRAVVESEHKRIRAEWESLKAKAEADVLPRRGSGTWLFINIGIPVATILGLALSVFTFSTLGAPEPAFFEVVAQTIPVLVLVVAFEARMFRLSRSFIGVSVSNVALLLAVFAGEAACLIVVAGTDPTWLLTGLAGAALASLASWIAFMAFGMLPTASAPAR